MVKRDKRIARMRQNPRQVRFDEPRAGLESLGFVGRSGKGDHWVFEHDLLPYPLPIDPRRPFVLAVYVRKALVAIDEVQQLQEQQEQAGEEDQDGDDGA
ncbi:MAG: hypothetical protein IT307_18180 [Chloroflexi bacterium]|nr:hypothetical protein [Chloroflexota bacterium]